MKPVSLALLVGMAIPALTVAALAANTSMMSSKPVTVTMKAQNGSGESGTATLTQQGADIVVKIALTHGSSTPQPAHIHTGTCANLNPAPKYPLTNVVNGASTTTLKGMKLSSLETGAFAVNVHKSAAALKVYVSCGNIPKMSSMGM